MSSNISTSSGQLLLVLNIDNLDRFGTAVLNDERLMGLISLYPFIYSPRVRPFQDPDYEDWAWTNIENSFNKAYQNQNINKRFTKEELKQRWLVLRPLLQHLTKAFDLRQTPESFRNIIVKMGFQLCDQTTDAPPKTQSKTELLILDNIPMVEKLPLEHRKLLETEIMDLILNTEMNSKGTVKLRSIDAKLMEHQAEKFMKNIQMPMFDEEAEQEQNPPECVVDFDSTPARRYSVTKEKAVETTSIIDIEPHVYVDVDVISESDPIESRLPEAASTDEQIIDFVNTQPPDQPPESLIVELKRTNAEEKTSDTKLIMPVIEKEEPKTLKSPTAVKSKRRRRRRGKQEKSKLLTAVKISLRKVTKTPSIVKIENESPPMFLKKTKSISAAIQLEKFESLEEENDILIPMKPRRLIPLEQSGHYTKQFHIRMKRINIEEYVSLSRLKQKLKRRSTKRKRN